MSPDLRFAARSLRRSPGFTAAIVLTLGLGIGANTAVFTALSALLLEPLPYPDPDRLVAVHAVTAERPVGPVSLLDVLDFEEHLRSFEALGAYRLRSFGFAVPGAPESRVIQVGMVTSGFLPALRPALAAGRGFTGGEETSEAPVVVLGPRLWKRLGPAAAVVGSSVTLNEVPHTVVGVLDAPLDFAIDGRVPDAFIPLSHRDYGTSRQVRSLEAVGRLANPVGLDEARAEIETMAAGLAAAYPETNHGIGAGLQPLDEHLRGRHRRPLLLLLAATGLLLGIACVNVAGLLLERLLARGREMALRAALGARSMQALRPFLAESLFLSAAGGVVALVIARLCLAVLPVVLPLIGKAQLSELEAARLRIDVPTITVALALCAATALFFGLTPGLVTRRANLNRLLRTGGRQGERHGWLRRGLVVAQVAMSLVLLFSTGLLAHSLLEVLYADPGFQTERVVRFGLGLPEVRYDTARKLGAFHRELLDRLAGIPGVEAAGAVAPLPLGGRRFASRFQLDDGPDADPSPRAAITMISPGYLEALRIPLLAGRPFTWRDGPDAPRVVLVNDAFRRRFLPAQDALGRRLRLSWTNDINARATRWEIVGVVGDTRARSLEEAPEPSIFLPMGQFPPEGCNYVLRSAAPSGLAAAVREAVQGLDGELERPEVGAMREIQRRSLGDRRLGVFLMGMFAGTALLLTTVGIYGAVAIHAYRRRHEMAIRMALGARPGQVSGLIVRQGLLLAGLGVFLGAAAARAAGGLLRHQLYEVPVTDPPSLLAGAVVLGLAALVGSALPARRAALSENLGLLQRDS